MLNKYGKALLQLGVALEQSATIVSLKVGVEKYADRAESGASIMDFGKEIGPLCNEIGLELSVVGIDRFVEQLEQDRNRLRGLSPADQGEIFRRWTTRIDEIRDRIIDELGAVWFLRVPPEEIDYYTRNPFSASVCNRFPKATSDMEEAGKCLALGRYPSCVFHLMRVLDAGLKRLGEHYDISVTNPNWNEYRQKLLNHAKDIEQKHSDQAQTIRDVVDRYQAISGIRNPLAHSDQSLPINSQHRIETKYTREEAIRQLANTRSFMDSLTDFLDNYSDGKTDDKRSPS